MDANPYEDRRRAQAYATLEARGTYYLAYRDLPEILAAHVKGTRAIDFGCGAGRSTRLLEQLGFDVVGVDISTEMIEQARQLDPRGDYRLIDSSGLSALEPLSYDLALSCFPFDNVPREEEKVALLTQLQRLLTPDGRLINLVSSPELYVHEWASFSTRDFPNNLHAKSGDVVGIVITDVDDRRPIEDVLFTEEGYRRAYRAAGLETVEVYRPLGRDDEQYEWVNETRIAPWTIYVLKRMPAAL